MASFSDELGPGEIPNNDVYISSKSKVLQYNEALHASFLVWK